MRTRKKLFERIPLHEVPVVTGSNGTPNPRPAHADTAQNVQKQPARPKRSIKTDGADHPAGLWINWELLRRHRCRSPQVVLHDPLVSGNSRYLLLGDVAFGNDKPRMKKKVNGAEAQGND